MKYDAILFDLDGTLLPMNQDIFINGYFTLLTKKAAPFGYDPKGLISAVWTGTKNMIKNDGSVLNDVVFWRAFEEIFGEEKLKDKSIFDEFYEKDFDRVKEFTGFNELSGKLIQDLKKTGVTLILATNPVFPEVATKKRATWAGLDVNDFKYITTYENIGFCKPNVKYYEEILKRYDLDPKKCLMVGNDVSEDMVSKSIGMDVFLLTDCLINKNNEDISIYPNGDFHALHAFLFGEEA